MKAPRLIAISDLDAVGTEATLERARLLCSSCRPGTVLLQLRERSLAARSLLQIGRALSELCAQTGQTLAVNDRLDVALSLRVDAVHLGERSVRVSDARRLLPDAFVYTAAHDAEAVLSSDADAVVLAPVMAPRKGAPALGLEVLTGLRHALGARTTDTLSARPRAPLLFALGGITAQNAAACLSAGADGVAAQGAVWQGDAWRALCEALEIQK